MIFLVFFSKDIQISNFMKIRRVAAEFFLCGQTEKRADGQTDMTKLTVAFHNFANDPNNVRDIVKIFEYLALGSN
jgi:hypothetical protein